MYSDTPVKFAIIGRINDNRSEGAFIFKKSSTEKSKISTHEKVDSMDTLKKYGSSDVDDKSSKFETVNVTFEENWLSSFL
ncbi:hypothetical protein SALIVA_2023 [Streptococcus salivarius JIM8777]|nr:hypothetical protein SALIVA_2023 [Streptococcus salivarius JIM8777]